MKRMIAFFLLAAMGAASAAADAAAGKTQAAAAAGKAQAATALPKAATTVTGVRVSAPDKLAHTHGDNAEKCYVHDCEIELSMKPLTNKQLRIAVRGGGAGRAVFGFSDFGWRILERIAQKRNLKVVQQKGPYSEDPEALRKEDVEVLPAAFWQDAVLKSYTPIDQPIAYPTIELSAPSERAARFSPVSPEKWKGLRIAHISGVLDTRQDYLKWAHRNKMKATLVDFDDILPAMEAVRRGDCDLLLAAVNATPAGFAQVAELGRRPTYIAVRNDLPTLRGALANDVAELKLKDKAWFDSAWREVFGGPMPANMIRMGVYFEPGLIERGANGEIHGSVLAYMHRIAELNGWLIDFVHCDYNSALKGLSEGRLDIVGGVTHTRQRQKTMLFSRFSAGHYQDFIYSHRLPPLSAETAHLWQRAHLVMGPGEEARGRLEAHFARFGIQATISEFPTAAMAINAYASGAADALFSVAYEGARMNEIVATFPAVPWYFCLSLGREDMRQALDSAIVRIQSQFPGFQEVTRYGHTAEPDDKEAGLSLTPSERAWLAVRTGTDKPVYVEMSPPVLLWKEWDSPHRRAEGVLVKYLEKLSAMTGLKFVCLPPVNQSIARLRFLNGEADLWASYMADLDDLPKGHKRQVIFSNPTVCAVRRGVTEIRAGETRFAVLESDSDRRDALTRRGFGDELVLCHTEEDCFNAILARRADAAISAPRSALVLMRRMNALEDIEIRNVPEFARLEDVAFEISPKADPMLVQILEKVMRDITPMDCEQMVREMVYSQIGHTRFTTLQFVVLVASVVVLALSVLMVVALQLALRAHRTAIEASAAGEAKTQFLSTISHEIRTPLNVLVGFADFLNQPDLSKDQVREYTDGIRLSAQVLLSLINDVLDLSKLEAGKMDLSGQCNLPDLFSVLKVMFYGMAKQKGLHFEMYLQPGLPVIGISSQRLRQVLFNLISNAVKYTEKGTVRVEGVGILAADEAHVNLTFRVSDTGIGISPEKAAAVFDPFVQDMSRRGGKVFEGTGLGLAIVKRLVDVAGGTVSLESRVGVGSVFTVQLPDVKIVKDADEKLRKKDGRALGTSSMQTDTLGHDIGETVAQQREMKKKTAKMKTAKLEAEKAGQPPTKDDLPPVEDKLIGDGLKILVVDDVALNLRVFTIYLKKLGVTDILVASDGAQALEVVKAKKPEIVFTDMWMPKMNGSELAEAIRLLPYGSKMKVVAVTADADSAATFRLDAFDVVMTKPVTEEKIVSVLNDLREGGGGKLAENN